MCGVGGRGGREGAEGGRERRCGCEEGEGRHKWKKERQRRREISDGGEGGGDKIEMAVESVRKVMEAKRERQMMGGRDRGDAGDERESEMTAVGGAEC